MGQRLVSAGLLCFLTACTSTSLVSDIAAALWDDKYSANHDAVSDAPLNPVYRYLRVEASGSQPALLVLGYVDDHPTGAVQVWYSAKGEVLKLQNGRIVGTAGLAADWSAVSFSPALPTWDAVTPQGLAFTRTHDQAPGYRATITHRMQLKPWPGLPPVVLPRSLPTILASRFNWYQELAVDGPASHLPPAWYAVGTYEGQRSVVYSEQCLSPTLCLKMQLWPPEKVSP